MLSTIVYASRCAPLLLYILLYDVDGKPQGGSARLPPDNYSSLALASSSRSQVAAWLASAATLWPAADRPWMSADVRRWPWRLSLTSSLSRPCVRGRMLAWHVGAYVAITIAVGDPAQVSTYAADAILLPGITTASSPPPEAHRHPHRPAPVPHDRSPPVAFRISSCTICRIPARRARRQVRTIKAKAVTARSAQAIAVWTAAWAARHSTGRPTTELSTPTAGLVIPKKPLGALRCRLPRWSGASQRRSLKCNSEQMATTAADSATAMAPLRTTNDGDGCGKCFLAALRSGAAPPITMAS